jgi:uncharacterized membrane protein YesL
MKHDGKIAGLLEVGANFAYLNALFILSSLPVITIGPAWMAMMGMIREWRKGNEPPITRTFFNLLKRNFKSGLWISILQLASIIVLIGVLLLMKSFEHYQFIFLPFLLFAAVTIISMSLLIYPLLLNYEMTFKQQLQNVFYLTFSKPLVVLVFILIVGLLIFLSNIFRFLPFLCVFSLLCFINYKLFDFSTKGVKQNVQQQAKLTL